MDYCGIGSVADLIGANGPKRIQLQSVTESQVQSILNSVVKGLVYLHQKGIVHRDILSLIFFIIFRNFSTYKKCKHSHSRTRRMQNRRLWSRRSTRSCQCAHVHSRFPIMVSAIVTGYV
jgi:hypothetical protein